jgi:hypothetical protein
MTLAIIDAIAARLVSAGVGGGTSGWTVTQLTKKDAERNLAILPAGGPEGLHRPNGTKLSPRIQIQVTGPITSTQQAAIKAESVAAALNGATLTGIDHITVAHSGLLPLGQDDAGRPLYVVNVRAQEA